jgi:beta-glucosidase
MKLRLYFSNLVWWIFLGLVAFILTGCSTTSITKVGLSSETGGRPDFMDDTKPIDQRIADLLSRMTLNEKISQMGSDAPAIRRLGIPAYNYWSECLHGIAWAGTTTVFPQAIGMASTWNPDLIHKVASAISDEARAMNRTKGKGLTYWSPVVNIGRDPRWGRTEEGYGEDPCLASRIGVAFVQGLQGKDPNYLKTVSTPKHFAANNEEYRRHYGSSEVDEKSLREYYFPAFKACVMEGGAYSVMGAYNALNGIPCCCNPMLLDEVLRKEWGFKGYVVSDCGAIWDIYQNHQYTSSLAEASALSVKAGCDLNCGDSYQSTLKEAMDKGMITEQEIDRALGRVLKARFLLGEFDPPEKVPYSRIDASVVDCQKHRDLALQTARESIVLLKNENNFLPLNPDIIKKIAVIGPNGNRCVFGGYSGSPAFRVTPLEGIRKRAAGQAEVIFEEGCGVKSKAVLGPIDSKFLTPKDGTGKYGLKGEYFNNMTLAGEPALVRVDKAIDFDWDQGGPHPDVGSDSFSVRWTGTLKSPESGIHQIGVISDDGVRFYLDGKLLIDEWADRSSMTDLIPVPLEAGREYDVKIEYYENAISAEMKFIADFNAEDNYMKAVALAETCDVAVLVMGTDLSVSREGLDMESIELPGSQNELIQAVCGVNPNVVLVLVNGNPLAINWEDAHVPAILETWYSGQSGGTAIAEVLFGDMNPGGRLPSTFYQSDEQLPAFHDYDITQGRTYMYLKEKPLYPFGHGLSYTTFDYNNLQITPASIGQIDSVRVSVDVKNTGNRAGDEVVQCYVRDTEASVIRPVKQLRGFRRIHLDAGETKTVEFSLSFEDLAFWDVGADQWVVEPGEFQIQIGSSSADIRAEGSFQVE